MIIEAGRKDAEVLSELSLLLWENADPEELRKEYDEALSDDGNAFFIKYEGGEAAGFAHCALRGEYTEGVINLPAGYLEAVFVKEKYRRKGFAQKEDYVKASEWYKKALVFPHNPGEGKLILDYDNDVFCDYARSLAEKIQAREKSL